MEYVALHYVKYTVRVERQPDIISVVCDGTVIWSVGGIDEKRQGVSERVRFFNKYPTTRDATKLALAKAFPPEKVKVPWWFEKRKKKPSHSTKNESIDGYANGKSVQ